MLPSATLENKLVNLISIYLTPMRVVLLWISYLTMMLPVLSRVHTDSATGLYFQVCFSSSSLLFKPNKKRFHSFTEHFDFNAGWHH